MKIPDAPAMRADLAALLRSVGEEPEVQVIESMVGHVLLLAKWNPRYHLTAIHSWGEILDRHIAESLLAVRWICERGRLLDIGSGNGFPALPILACRPGLEAVLVERSERKSLFLEAALRDMRPLNARVETWDISERREGDGADLYDLVISRATLPVARYLAVASTWVRDGGRVILYARGEAGSVCRDRGQHGLELTAREAIAGRRDSFLYVLTRPRTVSEG